MKIIENNIKSEINGKYFDEIKIYGIKTKCKEVISDNLKVNCTIEYNDQDKVGKHLTFFFKFILSNHFNF